MGGAPAAIPSTPRAECMINHETGKPHTAHTTNKVPFFVINNDKDITLRNDASLCDVAPTVLKFMGISQPEEMSGKPIVS